jgi:hypothetical protein
MRIQILVSAPGENLANARRASVTIHSSPGPNQNAKTDSARASEIASAFRRRAVTHKVLCGGKGGTPQDIVNNCGEPIRNYAVAKMATVWELLIFHEKTIDSHSGIGSPNSDRVY